MNSRSFTWKRRHSTFVALCLGAIVASSVTGFKAVTNSAQAQDAPGNGLKFQYFTNANLAGEPAISEIDPNVEFDWGTTGVAEGFPHDGFSVRWRGSIEAPTTGTYRFATEADDGVRLRINGSVLIDAWTPTTTDQTSTPVSLVAGQRYNLELDYHEIRGNAFVKLQWIPPGDTRQIVPQRYLYSSEVTQPPEQSSSTTMAAAASRTVSYEASNENFPNPERGYTFQNDPPWPADGVKWDFCGQGNNATAYNYDAWNTPLTAELIAERRALGQSVIQSRYHIAAFRTQDLTDAYLAFLERDFATARQGGIKLVIRFAYNYPFGGPDATLERVLRHLDQLKPVLTKNKDVIAFMEAGFVGCWGEWHHSSNGLNYEDRDTISPSQIAIMDKILQVLPKDRMVAMRYPRQMYGYFGSDNFNPVAPLTATTAFTGSNRARVGIHDDCLVCSDVNGGTFLRDTMTQDKAFLKANNLYVVQGGEVGTPESIDPAVPAVANSPLASCEAVRTQFREQRYSVVGLFDTANPASSIKRWEREGCGAEFQQRVGYRFRLIESTTPTTAVAGSSVKLSITIANDGYARPFNPRQVELVMRNNATGEAIRLPVSTLVDTRLWLPGPGETQTLSTTVGLPAGVTAGNYDLLLNLPDPEPALNTRPEFSMRLANTNVWESTSGYNNLRTSVNVSTSSQPPQTTAPQPPQEAVKIMAVGDSLTEGNGPVPGAFQSYRGHLYNSLVAAGYQIDMVGPNRWFTLASAADGEYAGNAGFTIGPDRSGVCTRPAAGAFEGCPSPHNNIYENIDGWIALYKPNVITLMIGANDQFPETLSPGATGVFRDVDKSEGAAKLEALVSKIRQAAPEAQLVLGGLSRVAYTDDTAEMAAIRATAKRLADTSSTDTISYADVWSADLKGSDFADTVHYSDSGAAKVAAVWLPHVKAALDRVP